MTLPDVVAEGRARITSFFDYEKRPIAYNKIISELEFIRETVDATLQIAYGTSLSSSYGQQVDDIALLFNLYRMGRTDIELKNDIYAKIAQQSGGGTPSDILSFLKTITRATFVDIVEYPYSRYSIVTSNRSITLSQAKEVDKAAAGGVKIDVSSEDIGTEFCPSCLIAKEAPGAITGITELDDTTTLLVVLEDGSISTLGFPIGDLDIMYGRTEERSWLGCIFRDTSPLMTTEGTTIEAITPSGTVVLEITSAPYEEPVYLSCIPDISLS